MPFLRRMFHAVAGGNIVVTVTLVVVGVAMVLTGQFLDPTMRKTSTVDRNGYRAVAVSPTTGAKRYAAVTLIVLGTIMVLIAVLPYMLLMMRHAFATK